MTPEEKIKYHEYKIAELKKQLNTCDIKQGELCYFWDGERPKKPITGYFHSYENGGYKRYSDLGDGYISNLDCSITYKHCEPVIKKHGLKLWVARDGDGKLILSLYKPEKGYNTWIRGIGFLHIPSDLFPNVKWQNDEPTLIEV